jgi:hypothetical protein
MKLFEINFPTLHPTQQEIYDHPARYKVLACGRRWGKDTLLDRVVILALLNGMNSAILVPKDIDADKIRERHHIILRELELAKMVKWKDEPSQVRFEPSKGIIRYYTVKNHASIRGSGLDLVILNECGELSLLLDLEKVWERVLRPTLIDRIGKAWFAGTPRGITSFYRLFVRGDSSFEQYSDWRSWQYSSFDNPHISAEEIEKMIEEEKLSPQSISQEIYAQFIDNEGAVFTGLDKICILNPKKADFVKPRAVVAGIDVGVSNDYTAISIMSIGLSPTVEYAIYRWRVPSLKKNVARILETLKEWHPVEVVVETNAIGEMFYQEIADTLALYGVSVTGHYTTTQSKSDVIFDLRDAMEKSNILLVADPEATAELSAFQSKRRESGTMSFGAPSSLHDDTVIARALAYSAAKRYVSLPGTSYRSTAADLSAWPGKSRNTYSLSSLKQPTFKPKYPNQIWDIWLGYLG